MFTRDAADQKPYPSNAALLRYRNNNFPQKAFSTPKKEVYSITKKTPRFLLNLCNGAV